MVLVRKNAYIDLAYVSVFKYFSAHKCIHLNTTCDSKKELYSTYNLTLLIYLIDESEHMGDMKHYLSDATTIH